MLFRSECHESIGFLDKLKQLLLFRCEKFQNLPSHLMWKSIRDLDLSSGSTFEYFFGDSLWINGLYAYCCKNVVDLEDIIDKLPPTEYLYIFTGRPTFLYDHDYNLESQAFLDLSNVQNPDLSNVGNRIELDFLMKSDYSHALVHLYLNDINIITIPESIITGLETLGITSCKYLQEIPRLPRFINGVYIVNSYSLNPQSSNRLLSKVSLSLFHTMLYRNTLFTFSKIHY